MCRMHTQIIFKRRLIHAHVSLGNLKIYDYSSLTKTLAAKASNKYDIIFLSHNAGFDAQFVFITFIYKISFIVITEFLGDIVKLTLTSYPRDLD